MSERSLCFAETEKGAKLALLQLRKGYTHMKVRCPVFKNQDKVSCLNLKKIQLFWKKLFVRLDIAIKRNPQLKPKTPRCFIRKHI